MLSLLFHGREESLLPTLAATVLGARETRRNSDAAPIEAPAPGFLLLELATLRGGPTDAAERIREHRARDAALPILVVYDEADRERAVATLIDGADAILPQPFHLDAFAALVQRLAARPAAAPVDAAPSSNGRHGGDEALAELVRRVAHEVNNPLTTIRGLLQLLLHDPDPEPPREETRDTYQTMERETRRISEVVDELEYFAGVRRPARTMVDLGELTRDALAEFGLQTPPRLRDASLRMLADREQVRFALRHQIGFLTRVCGPGPADLSVKLLRLPDLAVTRVRGRVRAAPDLEKCLLPLIGDAHEAGEGRWSLAGAHGIARAHGGRVAVEQRKDGRLEVRLELPIPPHPHP